MSFDWDECASESIEDALDLADRQAQTMPLRYTHDDVFGSVREMLDDAISQAL